MLVINDVTHAIGERILLERASVTLPAGARVLPQDETFLLAHERFATFTTTTAPRRVIRVDLHDERYCRTRDQ